MEDNEISTENGPQEHPIVEQIDTDFIDEFAASLKRVYEKHFPRKGDSWKDCDIEFLNNKLLEEMFEVETSGRWIPIRMGEFVDLALVAAMLWARDNTEFEERVDRAAERLPDDFNPYPSRR